MCLPTLINDPMIENIWVWCRWMVRCAAKSVVSSEVLIIICQWWSRDFSDITKRKFVMCPWPNTMLFFCKLHSDLCEIYCSALLLLNYSITFLQHTHSYIQYMCLSVFHLGDVQLAVSISTQGNGNQVHWECVCVCVCRHSCLTTASILCSAYKGASVCEHHSLTHSYHAAWAERLVNCGTRRGPDLTGYLGNLPGGVTGECRQGNGKDGWMFLCV